MIPDKVYVLTGEKHERPEHEEPYDHVWVVAVYPDVETADRHQKLLRDYRDEIEAGVADEKNDDWYDRACPFDDATINGEFVESTIRYHVVETPFVLHPDQYQERFDK